MPKENSDYKRKQRVQDVVKGEVNKVVAKAVGYDLKRPAIFDFYQGEWYGLDFGYLKSLNPLRVVWQVTFGPRGRGWNDKMDYGAVPFVTEARNRGIKYGLYHLMLPGKAAEQARFYCKSVNSLGGPGDMMPVLDVEQTGVRGKEWATDVKIWLDIVENEYGERPLIYTNPYYWSFLNSWAGQPRKSPLVPPAWTKDYMLWSAGYPWVPYIDANATMPKAYRANGFTDWAVWQYYPFGRSTPPRGFPKSPTFPANDLNVASAWFEHYLEDNYG